jgi:hypothetical protein
MEPQAEPFGKKDIDVVMFAELTVISYQSQIAGHPQVDDQDTYSSLQEQILATPTDFGEPLPWQHGFQDIRDRPA